MCSGAHTRPRTREGTSRVFHRSRRLLSLLPFSFSPSLLSSPRPRGSSSFCLPSRGGGGGSSSSSSSSGGGCSPSGANPACTFVCLNWVAFYARASNVNRILNYYSDCISPVLRYLSATLLISESRETGENFRVVSYRSKCLRPSLTASISKPVRRRFLGHFGGCRDRCIENSPRIVFHRLSFFFSFFLLFFFWFRFFFR